MNRLTIVLASLIALSPASAQTLPQLDRDNPRLQTIRWSPGELVQLTALPQTGLTVMLEPGEQIQRAVLNDNASYDVRVSSEGDSFLVLPMANAGRSILQLDTDRRSYTFSLETSASLMAAYLVRFDFDNAAPSDAAPAYHPAEERWPYRLRGDRAVRPAAIADDGTKTWIDFAPEQALSAIFAIGPNGDEQVVNGYMREDQFVIDRVYQELVFRIDRQKATARRADEPEER